MSAAALAKRIKVPRTTAHRVLDTLIAEGYVLYHPEAHDYGVSDQVRRLSFGFNRDGLVAEVARPILEALCQQVLTPVGLAAPIGQEMVILVSMDFVAPLALERVSEGTTFSVVSWPSGVLFLAHCSPEVRRELIASALDAQPGSLAWRDNAPLDRELNTLRDKQYAMTTSSKRAPGEGVIAVPIFYEGRYVASVHLRYMKRVMSASAALERYLVKLRGAALAIEQVFAERMAGGSSVSGINGPLLAYDEREVLY